VSDAQRILLLSVVVGVVTGLVIVCFHVAIELLAWQVLDAETTPFLRVLLPALGAASAALLVRYLLPASAGSGIVHTKSALFVSNGYIPASAVPGKFAACWLSIGTGTPLGPEDPSLLMGAGIASTLGRLFELPRRAMRLVAPIGAAAGIAAAFNTPITGVLFVMEEVVAAWDAAVLGSIVLASVSAVVVTRMFLGDAPLFRVPELEVVLDPAVLLGLAALGVAAGLFATIYVQGVAIIRKRTRQYINRWPGVAPALAGALAGLAGLWLPEVLGPGYAAMDAALHQQYPWQEMATLGGAKLVVAALAFGAGVPGGLFAPTLFLGVMVGGTVGGLLPEFAGFASAPLVMFILAGMAGVFAGVFRAPMTAIFMVFEVSGSSAIIVPAMITATLALLVARTFHPRSLLDLVADEEGAVLPSARQQREDEPLRIEEALGRTTLPVLTGHETMAEARDRVGAAAFGLLCRDGRWQAIPHGWLDEVCAAGRGPEPLGTHEGWIPLAVAHLDEPLDVALRRLAGQPVVPVVSRLAPATLEGVVTVPDVHAAYGIRAASDGVWSSSG